MYKFFRNAVHPSLRVFFACAFALSAVLILPAAKAQLPAVAPVGARVAYYTGSNNFPAYSGVGGYGAMIRDSAGNIFVLDSKPQILEIPVSGPMQVVVPSGDSAFNCGTTLAAGFELAVDNSDNLYVGHTYSCATITKVARITTAGSSYGTYCTSTSTGCTAESSVYANLNGPLTGYYYQTNDLAIDAAGNAYVASSKGLLMSGPNAPTNGALLSAAATNMTGVVLDASGDVFYTDGTSVYEITASQIGNSTPASTKIGYYGSGTCPGCTSIPVPNHLFMDSTGNLYVSSTASPYLVVIPNSTSGYGLSTYTVSSAASASYATGTKGTVDNYGNFYLYNGTSVERYGGGSYYVTPSSNNFAGTLTGTPTSNGGGTAKTPAIVYLFSSPTTLNATTPYQVLSGGSLNGGAPATLFNNSSTTGCSPGAVFAAGGTCLINFNYLPKNPGIMGGAVVLYGTAGQVLNVFSLEGIVTGPMLTVDPGVQTTIGSGYKAPSGIAIDAAGNMYVADPAANAVYKYAAGSTTAGTTVGTGLSEPSGVAVDKAGNVYIADTGNDRVVVVPNELVGPAYTSLALNSTDQTVLPTTGYVLSSPRGVALDSFGVLYIADTGNSRVLEVPTPFSGSPNAGIPVPLSLSAQGNPNGYAFVTPYGIAIDSYNNLYVADAGANAVWLIPGGQGLTGSLTVNAGASAPVKLTNSSGTAFSAPTSVAVDASGSVYVADGGNGRIVRLPATSGTYSITPPTANTAAVVMYSNLSKPFGIAIDQTADVFFTDQTAPKVVFVQRSVANANTSPYPTALAFGSAPIGSTTSAQIATLSNTGYLTALSLSVLPSPSAPFNETGTTCSTSSSVAAGSSCTLSLTYGPAVSGASTGTLSFTDNALNTASAVQSFGLTGDGVGAISTITISGPAAIVYGDGAAYTITAKDSSGNVITLPSGTPYTLTVTGGAGSSSPYAGTTNSSAVVGSSGSFNLPSLGYSGSSYSLTVTVNSVSSAPATLTVGKAQLYVTANNVSRAFDVANPSLTTTYSGFQNGDTSSVLSGAAPTITTTATRVSPYGNYPILLSGGSLTATNYNIVFVAGSLSVTGSAPQSILFPALPSMTHGATTYTLTGQSTSGLPLVYSVTSGSATISGNVLTLSAAGAVTITAYQYGNSSYAAASPVTRSFTAQ